MKYLHLLLFILPLSCQSQGVKWEKSLAEAFREARKQDTILFVEFYSPGCPYCQRVAPFFKEKEVADLYNTAFVNYQLDVETEEGREFAQSTGLDVFGIPYFLFFRGDSTLVHARDVSADLNSVLQPGKMVIEKTYTGENYDRRFEAGERSENFLTHYAIFSRVKKDTATNKKAIDALWATYPVAKRNSRTSWIIVKKALMDAQNGFADYWLGNVPQAKAYEDASSHGNVENAFSRLLYGTLFSTESEHFSAEQWKALQEKFAPVLGAKETSGLIWEKEVLAHFREGNTAGALRAGEAAAVHFRTDAAALSYLARVFDENCGDCKDAVSRWKAVADENASKENRK